MADKIAKRGVSIFIDGKEVKNSVAGISSELRKLQAEQKKMTIGSDEYVAHAKKIEYLKSLNREHINNQKEIAKQYDNMSDAADKSSKKTEGGFSRMANGFNKYFALITTFIAGITGASLAFRKLAEDIAKMDDVYSDVMKTTQMTHDEVIALNEEFKKMDTRTSREELNKIAEAGGRIGVTKDKILEFTKAMDIANVALGDSFAGGVEEISTKLGKLKMLFAETKDMQIEKAYLAIASSINELGANGAASEANIAEFTTRMGSLPEKLKPSIADTLALGAAFEESGIEAEISSRAYNIFMKQAATESAKFAQVMGITAKEVENMINTNPLDFFLQFSEGLKGMEATDVAKTLDYLKVNADGANKAIGAAANNTDRFRELMVLSNQSFTEGTSVINEYNIKNNNLAAQLEKAKKAFNETALELGARLNPLLLKSVSGTTYLIKTLVELPKWLSQNKGMIISLAVVMTVYSVAVNAARIKTLALIAVEKTRNLLTRITIASNMAAAVAQAVLSGNMVAATRIMAAMNKVILMNPYVALGVAIAAVTIGLYKLISGSVKLTQSQQSLINIEKRASEQYETEASKIHLLNVQIHSNIFSVDERRKALDELKKIIPGYNAMLDKEGKLTNDNTKAIDDYLVALEKQIKLKAAQEEWENLIRQKRQQEKDLKLAIADAEKYAELVKTSPNMAASYAAAGNKVASIGKEITNTMDAIKMLETEIKKSDISTMKNKPAGPKDGDISPDGLSVWKSGKWVKIKTFDGDGSGENSAYKDAEKQLEISLKRRTAIIKQWYAEGVISEQLYNRLLSADTLTGLDEKLSLQKKFGQETIDTEIAITDAKLSEKKRELKQTEDIENEIKKMLQKTAEVNEETVIDEQEYGLATRLAILEAFHKKGLVSEEDYLKKLADLYKGNQKEINKFIKDSDLKNNQENYDKGIIGRKSYLDNVRSITRSYYEEIFADANQMASDISAVADAAANLVSTIVEAESKAVDNKYAAQLKAAKKAGKDTTAIEEQIEAEKLEIKKKYADLEFAITIAKIGADTAVAIMKAIAELGPIAGPIAAGLIGATGLAQIAVANAQRESVKNLWTGGFTGPGGKYEPKGVVHGNEFVANSEALQNPNLMPMFKAVDAAQRMGTVRSLKPKDLNRALRQESYEQTGAMRKIPAGNSQPTEVYVAGSISKMEKTINRLNSILDNGIDARSVISGNSGSYEQTKKYERYIKNASR